MEEKLVGKWEILYPEHWEFPCCREFGVKKELKDNQFEIYNDRGE